MTKITNTSKYIFRKEKNFRHLLITQICVNIECIPFLMEIIFFFFKFSILHLTN